MPFWVDINIQKNMGTTLKKETFYFSHDYSARSDEKIKRLIRAHGMEGYGLYWAIIEDLYNNANALRTDYDGIAFDMRVDKNTVESVVKNFDLFEINGEIFGSNSVQRRLDERNERSLKAKESAKYRWQKKGEMRTHSERMKKTCDRNAIKERKGNIYKEDKSSISYDSRQTSNENKKKEVEKEKIDPYPFEQFWVDYDKKVGDKKKIAAKWEKIPDTEKLRIMEYIPAYKEAQPEKRYRKNPETFINQKSWNDEIINANTNINNRTNADIKTRGITDEELAAAIRRGTARALKENSAGY